MLSKVRNVNNHLKLQNFEKEIQRNNNNNNKNNELKYILKETKNKCENHQNDPNSLYTFYNFSNIFNNIITDVMQKHCIQNRDDFDFISNY